MQRQDEDSEPSRSRPSSRRNSASSRRSSVQKEREGKKKSPLNSAPSSANSTPKKQVKQNLDFCVTGKQILRKSDRANSLPGYQRRSSGDALRTQRRPTEAALSPKKPAQEQTHTDSRDASLEDDMSLDLSQVLFHQGYQRRSSGDALRTQRRPTEAALSPKKPAQAQSHTDSRDASLEDDMSLDLSQVLFRQGYQRRSSGDALRTQRRPTDVALPPKKSAQSQTHTDSRDASLEDDMSLDLSQVQFRQDYQRRSLGEALRTQKPPTPAPKKPAHTDSRDASLEDDMSLDLSQVSDFEDTNSKYGQQKKFAALATSTPKVPRSIQKSRSASLQSQLHLQKVEHSRRSQKVESRQSISTFCSRDSLLYKSSSSAASNYRYGTELDYSSVSPEYSGQSSTDLSPKNLTRDGDMALSPRSQELHVSSCCVSSWQDCSDAEQTKVEDYRRGDAGEWNSFWANYNNSIDKVPVKSYYDQCPTPYRTEDINLADLDFSTASSRKRSPDDLRNVNSIIRNEGLHLTPRETQNIIKCAHILGNVLTKAIERRAKEKDVVPDEEKEETVVVEEVVETKEKTLEEKTDEKQECAIILPVVEEPLLTDEMKNLKRKSLTLNLKETVIPLEVKEEKRHETVTTQTDISLPNTKSAPKIFEKILRQLSKTSLEESLEKLEKKALESKELEKKALENRELKKKELEFRELIKDKCDTDKKDEVDK